MEPINFPFISATMTHPYEWTIFEAVEKGKKKFKKKKNSKKKFEKNSRKRCEISSKLTIKTPERRQCCRSGVFIVNFEHISHLVPVFLLLTLNNKNTRTTSEISYSGYYYQNQ